MFSIISQVHECEFLYSLSFCYPVTSPSWVDGGWPKRRRCIWEKWVQEPEYLGRATRPGGTCLGLLHKSQCRNNDSFYA